MATCFEQASVWRRTDDSESVSEAVERTVDGGTGELFYEGVQTDAHLHVRLSDHDDGGGVLNVILDQPLDPSIGGNSGGDTFTGVLCRAQAAIVRRNGTRFIEAKTDPRMVATVTVPLDAREDAVEDTVDALERISTEVSWLHSRVRRAVETYNRENT